MKCVSYTAREYFRPKEEFYINKTNESYLHECSYHTHDFVEICYVSEGKGIHLVNDRKYKVSKGDLFIINYNMQHVFYKEEKDMEKLVTCNVVFKPSFFDQVLKGIMDLDFSMLPASFLFMDIEPVSIDKTVIHLTIEDQRIFDELLNNMHQEYVLQSNGYISIIRAYLIQLVIRIVRCLSNEAMPDKEVTGKSPIVSNILNHLKDHYSEKINLDDLVLKSFFCKSYLCRIFKETTGMTMYDYVHILRINEACCLIQNTSLKMTEIAYKVGFTDYKSFNRIFQRITGKKPNEYRVSKPV